MRAHPRRGMGSAMWRDDALVRAQMTEIEASTRRHQQIVGDALPSERPKRFAVRRHAARVVVALALRLDASAVQR